jgi:23S rRNA (cytosine1962-C5)-methyltransferase
VLKSGRDRSVRNRHPRLFSGAIKQIDGAPRDGDIVDITDNKGEWLARGVLNRLSAIALRVLTWDRADSIDDAWYETRVARAFARRAVDHRLAHTNARRVIFAESDGLPGVIADDYAGHVVLELSALCAVNARDAIIAAIARQPGVIRVIEKLDDERLRSEYGNNVRLIASLKRAADVQDPIVEIREGALRFQVDLAGGQKTGFYIDQRDNRARVAAYCAGARVLNTFSYTGAFAVQAFAAGATSVINVDSSNDALERARANAALNGFASEAVCADAFDDLRARRAAGERFDVVILDPPKMAHNPSQIEKAARAYKDLNRVAMALLPPGGVLATFSCSGVVDVALFQQIVFSAALEAKRDARIVERLTQASDHPVLTSYPESEYLKGLIIRVE